MIYVKKLELIQVAILGKKAQVWKSTNFEAGLYDIAGFSGP